MANKRSVKKQIRTLCGELAAELLTASAVIDGFNADRVQALVGRIAALQVNALSHCSFAYEKSEKDFDDARAYRNARRSYNHKAFAKLAADTEAEVAAILKEMNAMLPQSVRDAVKQAAAE